MEESVVEQPQPVIPEPASSPENLLPAQHTPGYQPTRWNLINTLLDHVDRITNGRAGWLQRFFSYTIIGGTAALVNEGVFLCVLYTIALPLSLALHSLIANIVAWEISVMVNFVLNDAITFRHFPGRQRLWTARCLRFHITALVGGVLTYLIDVTGTFLIHMPPFIAHAIALGLVFIYNFSFHHIFTYRHPVAKS